MKNSAKKITYIALSVTLIIVSSFIKIPFLIPLSMQLPTVIFIVSLLGKYGAISVLIYALMGIIGLPVFANGGGITYVFSVSFGYILGFIIASLFHLLLNKKINIKNNYLKQLILILIFVLIDYLIGGVYGYFILKLYLKSDIAITVYLTSYILFYLIKDLLFCPLIALLNCKLKPILKIDF